jgi:hypothetical protein
MGCGSIVPKYRFADKEKFIDIRRKKRDQALFPIQSFI